MKVIPLLLLLTSFTAGEIESFSNDTASAATETKFRREASYPSPGLSDSYGAPLPPDTYGPPKLYPNYGPPSSNYGPPPPSFSPPKPVYGPPKPSSSYGPPQLPELPPAPRPVYGPPKPVYGLPQQNFGPPPKPVYGPPHLSHFSKPVTSFSGPPKPVYGPPPHFNTPPKPSYGPPSISFGPSINSPPDSFRPPKPIYGPPKNHGISDGGLSFNFSPPKQTYGPPPSDTYGPPPSSSFIPPPRDTYGTPDVFTSPPNDVYGPPPKPKPVYGPPKPAYNQIHKPKPVYGPPPKHKPILGPPKPVHGPPIKQSFPSPPKIVYGPPKFHDVPKPTYGQPLPNFSPPKPVYGPPSHGGSSQGPPGIPSPPTPPHITYDGWQPIPGISPQPGLSDNYGVPLNSGHEQTSGSVYDGPPPPLPEELNGLNNNGVHSSDLIPPSAGQRPSTDYGPPSDSHGSPPISGPSSNSYLPPPKEYDSPKPIYGPPPKLEFSSPPKQEYGPPPKPQYGPPPKPHFVPPQRHPPPTAYGPPSSDYIQSPPGTEYGPPPQSILPPSDNYGAPLPLTDDHGKHHAPISGCCGTPPQLSPPSGSYGTPENKPTLGLAYGVPSGMQIEGPNLHPKVPVKFREPVPQGLIEAIGESAEYKNTGVGKPFHGERYIPPSVPEVPQLTNSDHNQHSHNPHIFDQPQSPPSGPQQIFDSNSHGPSQNFQPAPDFHEQQQSNYHISQSLSYDLTPPNVNSAFSSSQNYGPPQFAETGPDTDVSNSHGQQKSIEPRGKQFSEHIHDNNAESGPSAESLVQSLGINSDSEILKSHSVDVSGLAHTGQDSQRYGQNIPIQGNFGSYTLQIQPANGAAGQAGVPHDQVLSHGLLQDILAAIEQQPSAVESTQTSYGHSIEPEHAGSEVNVKVQPPSAKEPNRNEIKKGDVRKEKERGSSGSELSYDIHKKGIALYYNSQHKNNDTTAEVVRVVDNGDGSYVNFNSPNSKYSYDLPSKDPKHRSPVSS